MPGRRKQVMRTRPALRMVRESGPAETPIIRYRAKVPRLGMLRGIFGKLTLATLPPLVVPVVTNSDCFAQCSDDNSE